MYCKRRVSASGLVENPFYNAQRKGDSQFDFGRYMENQGFDGVDLVVLQLGINDIFAPTDDEALAAALALYFTYIEHIMADVRRYSPTSRTHTPSLALGVGFDYGPYGPSENRNHLIRGGCKIVYGYLPFGQRIARGRSLASGDRPSPRAVEPCGIPPLCSFTVHTDRQKTETTSFEVVSVFW